MYKTGAVDLDYCLLEVTGLEWAWFMLPMPAAPRGSKSTPPTYLPPQVCKKSIHMEYVDTSVGRVWITSRIICPLQASETAVFSTYSSWISRQISVMYVKCVGQM